MLVPTSIDPTGVQDVAPKLNALFASLPRDGVLDFPEGARYRCEDVVQLGGKAGVTLNFNGAAIFATTRGYRERAHLQVASCRDVRVNRPKIQGANPYSGLDAAAYDRDTEAQHGIEILQSHGVTVFRPEIRSVFGDFIYIGRKNPTKPWSSWVRIISPFGRDNGRIGISITAASVVSVEDMDFNRLRRSVIDIEPDSSSDGAYAVDINGGKVDRAFTGFVLSSLGKDGKVSDVTVRNLYLPRHLLNCQIRSPEGTRTKKNIALVDDVSEERAERTPLNFTRVDGVTVRGNVQPLLAGVPLVAANDCTGVQV